MSTFRLLTWTWMALALTGTAFAQDPATAAPAEAAPMEEPAPIEAAPTEEAAPVEAAAPPDPAAEMTPEEAEEAAEEEKNATKCLIRDVCLGPVLTLGLLNPLGIGIHARIDDDWGVGFDYQFLPTISAGVASFSMSLITLNGRWYPGGGSFFLAAGFAYQMFDAEGTTSSMDSAGNPTTVAVAGSVGIPTFLLGLGVMGGSGFVMGIDLALEIPLGSADVSFDTMAPDGSSDEEEMAYASLEGDIKDAADTFVNLLPVLFQVNLIRIGYMF